MIRFGKVWQTLGGDDDDHDYDDLDDDKILILFDLWIDLVCSGAKLCGGQLLDWGIIKHIYRQKY